VTPRVTVVDYGLGNLHSVMKAFRHQGAEVLVTSRPDEVATAERLVLPGVGAFADGLRGLAARDLLEPLKEYAASGRPLLGICLGMQLLLGGSEEFGHNDGLGLVPGSVRLIPSQPGLKVPQIGWNRINPRAGASWEGTILQSVRPGEMVYFVHSYAAEPASPAHRLAESLYGGAPLCAAVQAENVVGCQFHPEKSGTVGLAIVDGFLRM
jgi:glutamine amidotransferase